MASGRRQNLWQFEVKGKRLEAKIANNILKPNAAESAQLRPQTSKRVRRNAFHPESRKALLKF